MIKKIISVILALSIALSCLCVPSFATPLSLPQTISRFFSELWDLTDEYESGKISKSEFFEKFKASLIRFDINYAAEATSFKDILDVIEFCGIDVDERFKSWWYENNEGEKDDSVLGGYGAVCVRTDLLDGTITKYYGDYGIIREVGTAFIYADDVLMTIDKSGTLSEKHYSGGVQCYNGADRYSVMFMGNWQDEEGEQSEKKTDLPDKTAPDYDDDSFSDDDAEKFFRDLLEQLLNEFPDLSTVEGLLRAILAKCTSIDERLENGGAGLKPSELQTMLDQAVLALTLSNKSTADTIEKSNDELLKELINIRKILQGFDSDEEIPPEEANSILQGLISGLTSGLISLIGSGLGDVEVSEIIEICTSAGTIGIKLLSGIVDVIALLGAIVPFSMIKTCIESTFNIMFNKNTPADLTFTLDGNSYSFLSASFLEIPIVAGSLQIIKGVVSIFILYTWLKWARKFYINLM